MSFSSIPGIGSTMPGIGSTTKGIRNLGNTCYISATLQCLYRCDVFCETLENLEKLGPVTSSLTDIFRKMSEGSDVDVFNMISALRRRPSSFLDYRCQNDAQEFFLELLDAIENECRDLGVPDATSVFYGKITYLTRCENCKNITRRIEPFASLSFSGSYPWSRESIDDFQCDHCHGRHRAEREGKIIVAPKILVIQVLRFDGNGRKSNHLIDPPTTMDLGPVHLESMKRRIEVPYASKGVVCHEGFSLHRGHYYSLHRNQLWVRCDDEFVTMQDSISKEEPYVLFYEFQR